MTTNTNNRARGIIVRVVPADRIDINGPFPDYALIERPDGQVRMVHYEGVAYEVRDDKPWTWSDYLPDCPQFSPLDLKEAAVYEDWKKTDLADWVKVFGSRCEVNFGLIRQWYRASA